MSPPHGNRPRFQWVREPTSIQQTHLAHTIARRVGRLLEREGLLERDTEQLDLVGLSITYRIAVGPHRCRKMYRVQTLPTCDEADWAAKKPEQA